MIKSTIIAVEKSAVKRRKLDSIEAVPPVFQRCGDIGTTRFPKRHQQRL